MMSDSHLRCGIGEATKDRTLVRKPDADIVAAVAAAANAVLPTSQSGALWGYTTDPPTCQWNIYAKGTVVYIGSHTYTGGASFETGLVACMEYQSCVVRTGTETFT